MTRATDRFDSLSGKVALVTGAATGIGRATAERLAASGMAVYGIGGDAEDGAALAASAAASGAPIRFSPVDIRDDAAVRAAVADAVEAFGRLDAVVNAAGVYRTGRRAEEVDEAEWALTLDINLSGTFRVCRAALPELRRAGGGAIVNIASVHALATVPLVPAYAASKGGVLALSRQLALDYAADRIRVNALIVGSVDTRMTRPADAPAGWPESVGLSFSPTAVPRIAQPAELAAVIAFLLSDSASFITGSGLVADGGMTALLF
ncbi:SDR family NAD(P)-dependent oxidoreductase [Prosthecomicrobium pneumaticum]|uniref:NAD(P)-dependent dehydrogenase (Short-subunit alcohol dehydrogenase family) n=1 Tax=Prosthecomicrobium pneumaticum TaxID=81895 RepID=A0A7W9CUJ7_9HYPH|nr:SDR family oxidoreductase [Prosthecomicrobium pneumaticum]MBB5752190.1 NAD(P)-dependent dehydrogenase (short-subunit alcohol dehydrogenase family) [Prosthecomicrobium pneumaticum]